MRCNFEIWLCEFIIENEINSWNTNAMFVMGEGEGREPKRKRGNGRGERHFPSISIRKWKDS